MDANIHRMTFVRIDMDESEIAWNDFFPFTEEVMDTLLEKRFWMQGRFFGGTFYNHTWEFLIAGDCTRAKAHLNNILSRLKSAGRIKVMISEGKIECHPGTYFLESNKVVFGKDRERSLELE